MSETQPHKRGLGTLAKRAVAAVCAVATAGVGLAVASGSAQAAEAPFPTTKYFSTTVGNLNIDASDHPAFRYGFSGYDQANASNPAFTDAQLNQANAYFQNNAAYCMDVDLGAPGDGWTGKNVVTVAESGTGHHRFSYITNPTTVEYRRVDPPITGAVAWVAAHGYPESQRSGNGAFAKPLDDPDARAITQLAIWIAAGQVRVQGGNGTTTATQAVSTSNGHLVAGGVYSGGGQTNFQPYTMIGLAWDLANKAANASDKNDYAAYYYAPANGQPLQRMLYAAKLVKEREVTLKKTSANPNYTTDNNAYDMTGAEYTMYSDQALTKRVATFVTDKNGNATGSAKVKAGTYWVKETKKPAKGYSLNPQAKQVTVSTGEGVQTILMDGAYAEPALADPGTIKVQKALADMDKAGELEGGVTSLKGVRFRVEWFKNIAKSEADLDGKTANAVAVWETNDKGRISYRASTPVEGSWPFQTSDGLNYFPLGTVRITEIQTIPGLVQAPSTGNHGSIYTITDSGNGKTTNHETLKPWNNNANVDNDPNTIAFPNQIAKGSVEVTKTDQDLTTSTPQGDATLHGTTYEVVNKNTQRVRVDGKDYAPDAVITTITTSDRDGQSVAATPAKYLPYGTYQIREKDAATGYHKAGFDKTFQIRNDGQTVKFTLDKNGVDASGNDVPGIGANANDVQRGGIQLLKVDRETGLGTPLGAATLDGTGFELVNRSTHPVVVNNKTYQPGEVVKTMSAKYDKVLDMDGNDTGAKGIVARTSINELPYGTYEARETVASEGYVRDGASRAWSKLFTIGHDGGDATTGAYEVNADANKYATLSNTDDGTLAGNQVQRGDFHFIKKDEDTMQRMGNIAWQLTSKTTGETHIIVSDKNGELHTKSCDAQFNDNGTGTTGCRPHTKNTNANDPDSPNSNGAVTKDANGNYVVKDASKLDPTTGVWFTGIGPDSKGQSVKWTNADTYTVTRDGKTHTVKVNNALRALPYDDYQLTELKTPGANDEHRMVSVTITAKEFTKNPDGSLNHDGNGIDFDYGTIDNKVMGMSTRLAYYGKGADMFDENGDTGDKSAPSIGSVEVIDEADYWGVARGDYTDIGQLYVVENGRIVGEPVATASQKLTVKNPNGGTAKLKFSIKDTAPLAGKTIVAMRTVTDAAGNVVVEHRDPADPMQQLHFPKIGTDATGDVDDEANAGNDTVTITDAVSYENLVPGKEYTLSASLHYRSMKDGKPVDGGIVKDKAGKDVTSSVTFTPDTANGSVDVVFTFTTVDDLAGKTAVAFESLTKNGVEFAAHADITDEHQDVKFPKIGTTAQDMADGDKLLPVRDGKVKDTVSYENLTPGREYQLTATMHAKSVGKDGTVSDLGVVNGKDGQPLTVTATFTPKNANGTTDVEFPVDVKDLGLEGTKTVMFEQLSRNDIVLAAHADITDEGQSVQAAKIGTTLTADNGGHELQVTSTHSTSELHSLLNAQVTENKDDKNLVDVTLTDTIRYENLIPGDTYRMDGELHVKDTSKAGEPVDKGVLTDHKGKLLTSSTKFKADKETGEVKVTFKWTAEKSALFNQNLVAYETLRSNPDTDKEQVVAEHKDITDEGQTVRIIDIATQAQDAVTGTHTGVHSTQFDQIDTVAYTGLKVGKTYEMRGAIHIKDKDGKDAGVLKDKNGQPIQTVATFTPTEPSGTVQLRFTAQLAEPLQGVDTVTFEDLYSDGVKVATHADISDKVQTVTYPKIGTQLTGDNGKKTVDHGVITLKDTIAYEGLTKGDKYHVEGHLVNDKGEPIEGATAKADFTAEAESGTIVVEFTVDTTNMADGSKLVAFERLYTTEGHLVAVHEDVNDEGQTVTVGQLANTGMAIGIILTVMGLLTAGGMGLLAISKRRHVTPKHTA